jgi:outer membrane protein OmpA-like peptidoglycan-associated protein
VQVQAELTGASYSGADFPQTKPADLVVGPAVWLWRGFFVRPALSWNLNFNDRGSGSGMVSYMGRQISIGYHPGTAGRTVVRASQAAVPRPAPGNRPPTVSCLWDKAVVRAGEQVRIRAQASDPDGDRLEYAWSTEQGRLTAQGAEAVLDSAGLAGPTSVAVTVRVSDGRGASAQAVCQGRLEAPREAESVTCTSAGFPRNSARLNNVDKACLDDVAARLRRDPRGRVMITGHAEPGERYAQVLSRKRAEAAKSYLVNERGVDESRITTRGSEAGAGGRGVEIELEATQTPPR